MPADRKLAVLCGAGASFDCASRSFTRVSDGYQPPLVKQLFDGRPEFDALLARNPKARALSGEIRARVADSSKGMEEILAELANRPSLPLQKQYRQVPLYLQEALGEVSQSYVRGGSNNFETLAHQVEEAVFEQVTYVTVNYDTLLERAVAELYDSWPLPSFDSYCDAGRPWSLFKLHGSVLWGRQVENCRLDWAASGRAIDCLNCVDEKLVFGEARILSGHHDSSRIVEGRVCYPWLSVPERGKVGFSRPTTHVELLTSSLENCTDLLVIGYSGLDEHVNELFRKTPRLDRVMVVTESEASSHAAREKLSVSARHTDSWHGGFDGFISSNESRRWLTYS